MSGSMNDSKQVSEGKDLSDALSDAASSQAEVQTLRDEELPSYADGEPGISEHQLPREKPEHNIEEPTPSAPFTFPAHKPPPYRTEGDFKRPLAIPQAWPSPTAPLLAAYPPSLLTYGITQQSWNAFLNTASAFLSATVSKQALHHASDVANSIGVFHKQYATHVKKSVKSIGKSAKNFNPFGVVGKSIGLTMGAAGHVVGSVMSVPGSLMRRPQTPRERAAAYLATANRDWLHARGLHALLMDNHELAGVVGGGGSPDMFTRAVNGREDDGAASQLMVLREWLGEVEVSDEVSMSEQPEGSPSSSSRPQPRQPRLQLGTSTLWLVVVNTKEGSAYVNPS